MFSALRQNSLFYILDKNNKPTLKVAKVVSISSVQYKTGLTQTIDVVVNADGETLNFNELPANLSIADSKTGVVVSESREQMMTEIENMMTTSQNILDNISYHESVVDSCNEMLIKLNPKFAKEKEQEDKIKSLECKVNSIETGISDMKAMMSELLNKK